MTTVAANLVRSTRRERGFSQRALAAAVHMSGSAVADVERSAHDPGVDTVQRLLNAAGYRLCAIPTRSTPAAEWADLIYRELKSSRKSHSVALRALIGLSDDLSTAKGVIRVALCVAVPPPCGDARYDAAIAGIVEHHLTTDGLPVPDWVEEPSRFLAIPWETSTYTDQSEAPLALQRHGVWLAAADLASV